MEITLKRIIDDSILAFKGWEFETEEDVYVEEYGDTRNLFRLEYDKIEKEYRGIFVANYDEYCIHEDASSDFPDYNAIIEEIQKQEASMTVAERMELNCTYYFLEYVVQEMEEEG